MKVCTAFIRALIFTKRPFVYLSKGYPPLQSEIQKRQSNMFKNGIIKGTYF